MDTINIVPNVNEGEYEQPLRQVCLPLMISPVTFKPSTFEDDDSDCNSDSDESVDMDDDALVFDFGEMASNLPDQSSRFTQGDMAPKFIMVEQTCHFPHMDMKDLLIVDDEEEEQIQEAKNPSDDEPLMQPTIRRSSSIGTFIFENKEALQIGIQDNIS